jgi:hypothetical protein
MTAQVLLLLQPRKSEVKGGAKFDGQTDMVDVINNDIF